MRRALRRAAGALLAAGALGLARPAPAQPYVYSPYPAGPAGAATSREEGGTPLTPGRLRLEEMKVEQAWLADMATFPYQLAARAEGAALEARGYVPNEAVRARALEVARRRTFLSVRDNLKVYPTLASRSVGVPAATLQREAARLLAEWAGEQARPLEVTAGVNGQVTLRGTVGSVEEKLALGRHLRRLRGCTCVVNRLAVQPVSYQGRTVTLVTQDGSYSVPGRLAADEGGPAPVSLLPPQAVRPAPRPASVPEVQLHPPRTLTPGPVSAVPPPRASRPLAQPIRPAGYTTASAPTRFASDYAPAARTADWPYGDPAPPRIDGGRDARPPTPAPTRPPQEKKRPLVDLLSVPHLPAGWFRKAKPEERPAPGQKQVAVQRPARSDPKLRPVALATPPPPQLLRPVPQPKPAPPPAKVTVVDAAAVAIPGHEILLKTWAPAYDTVGAGRVAYSTTGVMLYEEEPPPPPSSAASLALTRLRQKVRMVCGPLVKDVQVVVGSDRSVCVVVQAAERDTEQTLTARILELPEMASPGTRLEIQVAH